MRSWTCITRNSALGARAYRNWFGLISDTYQSCPALCLEALIRGAPLRATPLSIIPEVGFRMLVTKVLPQANWCLDSRQHGALEKTL